MKGGFMKLDKQMVLRCLKPEENFQLISDFLKVPPEDFSRGR
jgi:hypothetical protein